MCDRIEKIEPGFEYYSDGYDIDDDKLTETCLTREELMDYGKGVILYGWHISDLKIYDKPKELGEFSKWFGCGQLFGKCNKGCEFYNDCGDKIWEPITRPPQSWCYVEDM